MTSCPKCAWTNALEAKFCGRCGHAFMASGVSYPGVAEGSPNRQSGGSGNMMPTVPEGDDTGPLPPFRGGAQIGGAALTVQEDSGSFPDHGLGHSRAGGPRTELHEDMVQPLAGWLVVLRSRTMPAYHDLPVFLGRNVLGKDSSYPSHCLNDPNASGEHAMIIAKDDEVRIMDMGSTNGTIVNDQRVDMIALKKGDKVRIGKTTMVYIPLPATT